MSRPGDPQVPILAGNGAGIGVVLLIGWGLVIAAWLTWLAARIAAALTGRHVPTFAGTGSSAWPGGVPARPGLARPPPWSC